MRKTALITGGSRGIGFGIAKALAKEGYNLAINGVRDEKDVREALAVLEKYDIDVIYCQGNIGKQEDRSKIILKAFDHFGTVHVLVNNAGAAPKVRNDIFALTEDAFDYLININLKGTFFITQEVANRMVFEKKSNPGFEACIVSITSISAEVASLNRAEYCISKAGLGMMTKLFATALADVNIPVYEVRPGIIETDMTSGVIEKYTRLIDEGLTLERRLGKPDDIGKIVAAIVRGDIPYSTGQVFTADGGMGVRRL